MVRHHSKSQSGLNLQNSFFEIVFMGNTIISNAKRAEKKAKINAKKECPELERLPKMDKLTNDQTEPGKNDR